MFTLTNGPWLSFVPRHLARRYLLLNYGVKMIKFQLMSVVGLSMTLFACGGSGNDSESASTAGGFPTETPKETFIKGIAGTAWVKDCFLINSSYLTIPDTNSLTITINIKASLESVTTVQAYAGPVCDHHTIGTRLTFTTQLEITDKIISEEGIETYGLNTVFIESPDLTELPPSYSLIYHNSERLYYGIGSGSNAGESNETRHSSISLDNYFLKVEN